MNFYWRNQGPLYCQYINPTSGQVIAEIRNRDFTEPEFQVTIWHNTSLISTLGTYISLERAKEAVEEWAYSFWGS